MAVNPLPPQAFTKETLQRAYAWLLNQSPSIKEMASTQDMLVSLYLKAQRNGDAALETPSIQNFKQELKSLANLMGDLQTGNQSVSANTASSSVAASSVASSSAVSPSATTAAPAAGTTAAAATKSADHTASTTTNHLALMSADISALINRLDSISLNSIFEIKTKLNLSTEAEALRVIIAMGHRALKKSNLLD